MHLIHKWTKWEDISLTIWNDHTRHFVYADGQIRHCEKCGLRETRTI